MDIVPIFSRVLIGACESSLDIAGAALLPGAWPILKGALAPVMDRLKERLGGEELTSSRDSADKAIQAFRDDLHLQQVLRSKLLESLDGLVKSQSEINADIQKLMAIVSGDNRLLEDIFGSVKNIELRLEQGVNLSDETYGKLTGLIRRQAESSRKVRAFVLSEMGPVAQLVERQVGRLQARAVELIDEKQLDRAVDELNEGRLLVSALINEAPTDLSLQMQLGMIYKTTAQVWQAAGDFERGDNYIDRAERLFQYVKDVIPDDARMQLDLANAIHGLGNMKQMRGAYDAAIGNYRLAISIDPRHSYAWHDMFLCYFELARAGRADLDAMREALVQVKQTGQGLPGLGIQHIAKLDKLMHWAESNLTISSMDQPATDDKKTGSSRIDIKPLDCVVVVCESMADIPIINLGCELANHGSSAVDINRLDALVTTPAGIGLTLRWHTFYRIRPGPSIADGLISHERTGDAHAFALPGKQATEIGIQFRGDRAALQQVWLPGEYRVELRARADSKSDRDTRAFSSQFVAVFTDHRKSQIDCWLGADERQWDNLGDPDRAVGIPLQISSISETTRLQLE